MTVEEINKLESQVFAKDIKVEKENVVKLVDAYVLYAKQNPDDVKSADYLFRALDTYHQFLERYPNSPLAADVESSIKNVGIPLEELIKTFEQ
mgnify:CR=1 FL=1